MATFLTIEPTSYTFPDVNASTTLTVDTDAEIVKFKKVGSYGDGLATYTHATKTLTATRYGRAVYNFIGENRDGSDPIEVRYIIEVTRQIVSDREVDIYVPLGDNVEYEYTPPSGYYYKHVEILADDECPIELELGSNPTFRGNKLGNARARIILGKEIGDINPDDIDIDTLDDSVEYIGGYFNLKVFELVMDPDVSDIALLKDKEYTINSLSIRVADGQGTLPIQFDTEFNSNDPAFEINSTLLPSTTGDNEYMVDISSLREGEGVIKLNVNGEILHNINIAVEDRKIVTIDPNVDNITLGYRKSFVFRNVTYEDNEVIKDIKVEVPNKSPFTAIKTLANPAIPNVFNVTVTNTKSDGGEGSFIIKGIDTEKGQKTISVKCHKEVLPGVIETRPSSKTVRVVQSKAYEYDYVLATNASELIVETTDPRIAQPIIEPLRTMITEKDENGDTVIKEWPENSTVKKVYIVCQELGFAYVTFKSIINDDDVVEELRVKVEVSEVDTLPDYSSIINLKTKPFPKGRKKDIVIKTPATSGTLVFKSDLAKDLNIEFGYSYDYMSEDNPAIKSNPVPKSNNTGKPTWLNVVTGEAFTCLDSTKNNNVWRGNKGTWINGIEYPKPGHKNFGKGSATDELLKRYNLTKLPNSNNMEHEDYGIYLDNNNNRFAFVPKHHIIPIKNFDLVNKYPYYGAQYKFSYKQEGEFTRNTIPRCFINNGKIQEGIFVSITDGTTSGKPTGTSSAKSTNTSLPSVYKTSGNSSFKYDSYKEYSNVEKFPELREMQLVMRVNDAAIPNMGRHNMSIFIQNMLANLADLQIIACYENNISNPFINNCLSTPNTVSWTTTNKEYNPSNQTGNLTNEFLIKERDNGIIGPYSLSIDKDTIDTFTLSGYKGSIFHINGPINMPLPGVMVRVDSNNPDTYEIFTLKETVDIADMEQNALTTIGTSNVENLIFKTGLFDINNYDLICTLTGEEFKSIRFINTSDPIETHNVNGVSLLEIPDQSGRIGLNIGVDLYSLKSLNLDRYSSDFTHINKWRDCAFYIGNVSDIQELRINKTWYGFFTCNYCPNNSELHYSGAINSPEIRTNGTRNRILNIIGSKNYTKLNGSIYPITHRICITPNV